MAQQRDLPHDLIAQNIVTRLPIKPLIRFKSVSKQWYSTLCCRHYAQTHVKFPRPSTTESLLIQTNKNFQILSYENGYVDLVKMEVDFDVGDEFLFLVGSVNGLVCLGSTSGRLFIIWNPVTLKFRKYSDSQIRDFSPQGCVVLWGFGFVSGIDDYKIVRVCKNEFDPSLKVHVFSVRLDKWRSIDNNIPRTTPSLRFNDPVRRLGMLVNETVYWMVTHKLLMFPKEPFAFDLALELFDTFHHLDVTTPARVEGDGEYVDKFLCDVNGCLSKYGSFLRSGEGVITILKHRGESDQILVDPDLVGRLPCNKLIGFTGSDKFFTLNYDPNAPHLGVIDPSLRPIKYIPLMTFEDTSHMTIYEIISYSASLISPAFITGTPKTEDVNI